MKLFNIICLISLLFVVSCGDESSTSSNIPQITSVPEKVTFPYYPWDENSVDIIPDTITQEFEIFNKGKKELEITQINFLDPEGNLVNSAVNDSLKDLFKFQTLKTNNGIITSEWNDKTLDFNNENYSLAALCPLESVSAETKKCAENFDAANFNNHFKILLSYSKKAAETIKNNSAVSQNGDFMIEICSNDPMKSSSETCPEGSGSFRIMVKRLPAPPPKPIIYVTFDYTTGGPMSYRNIKDKVSMNLRETCVSDPEDPTKCLSGWEEKYYIRYKWETIESPTPLRTESQIQLPDSAGREGQWLTDQGTDNPKRAEFTGLMVTPRRLAESNDSYDAEKCETECGEAPVDNTTDLYPIEYSSYLLCRQKYCEKTKTEYYKIKIQAETVDMETDLASEVAQATVVPQIIPQARVVAQLTWKQGFRTKTEADSGKEGTKVDLDIHLIKRSSLEAEALSYTPTDGVMCTSQQFEGMDYSPTDDFDSDGHPDYEKYFRHDDCSFADQGISTVDIQNISDTIAWNASFDLDNRWGGGNYENPETIGLGPIEDSNGDGKPDQQIIDDQYLVVVGYSYCYTRNLSDTTWNTCCDPENTDCNGDGSAYEVDARVDILIDGFEAARPERTQSGEIIRPADNYSDTSKFFTIKPGEWKVIAAIKWDGTLPGPESNPTYEGDAIVTDIAITDEEIDIDSSSYRTCRFDITLCELVPIWDEEAYYEWVNQPMDPYDENSQKIGECY